MVSNHQYNLLKIRLGLIFLFIVSALVINAQTEEVGFGSKMFLRSQFGLGYYGDSETFVDIGIRYYDNDMMVSINNSISIGLHYNYIVANDRPRNEKDNFYRVGSIARYDISINRSKSRFYVESVFDYGNFVIELDDQLNKRNVFYLGFNLNLEVKIYKNLYGSAGWKAIRQLEKGDYGLENYPIIGLAYEFRK